MKVLAKAFLLQRGNFLGVEVKIAYYIAEFLPCSIAEITCYQIEYK